MIPIITKIVKEKGIGEATHNTKVSFLKYSTPASGRKLDDKVILLAFKDKDFEPFICVKTVRNYDAKEVIVRNFNNLKGLNDLIKGSPFENFFAKALYLHDDGENIFSIETACHGKRKRFNGSELERVVSKYSDFQEFLAKKSKESVNVGEFSDELVRKLSLIESDKNLLINKFKSLKGLVLPRILQHGDVTEDNILISDDSVNFIDCDYIKFTDIPGFDLFNLFYRHNKYEAGYFLEKYLPEYFTKIGGTVDKNQYTSLYLLYYLMENLVRKSRSSDAETFSDLHGNFEDLMNIK